MLWVFFNSRKHALVKYAYTLCDIEQVLLLTLNDGYVNKFQRHLLHLQSPYSQPSGEVLGCCEWHFPKPALSTAQCKFKAVS